MPKRTKSSLHLDVFPPTVPNRIIRGKEISAYYNIHGSATWARHQRRQIEIVLFFDLTVCHLSWGDVGSKRYEQQMQGRQICIIPAGQMHECRLEGRAELLVLYVPAESSHLAAGERPSEVSIRAVAQYDPEVWILATLLRRLGTAQIRPDPSTVDAIGGELARRLIAGSSTGHSHVRSRRCLSHGQKGKVMLYMQNNMKHDIHVIDLAKQTGLSVSHFTELFVNSTGKAPFRYLKELRLVRAYEMLLTGDYLVREAALAVGYTNSDHFGEAFRVFCGYSPRELLRRVRTGLVSAPARPVNHRGNLVLDEI